MEQRKGININRTIVWNDGRVSRATGKRTVQTSCPNASIVRSTVFPLSTRYDREFFGDSNSLLQVAVYVAPALFLQLKKFVQRINNGRRTTRIMQYCESHLFNVMRIYSDDQNCTLSEMLSIDCSLF
ncbi:PREDICTED: uncharacterized protein LOC105144175 isoform X2 [Acromyrmex echinatior]|uniref:uncharacterized protein LOC105144175 isoform X2 n=1 Tax=Acromyrmex echinatior TaxID=103372 RepID=UPI000580F31D|nr:PREDICTED: uncharacterized protein LOC105144175 isoform X2 [Acromyrmex echinatior]